MPSNNKDKGIYVPSKQVVYKLVCGASEPKDYIFKLSSIMRQRRIINGLRKIDERYVEWEVIKLRDAERQNIPVEKIYSDPMAKAIDENDSLAPKGDFYVEDPWA